MKKTKVQDAVGMELCHDITEMNDGFKGVAFRRGHIIRPEDIDIVSPSEGHLTGTVTSVTFKGLNYDIIVDFRGFKWLIQTTDYSPEGASIGIKIDPDGIHIMKKSHYSGMFGDYSSFSEEYDELDVPVVDPEEEESDDEE